MSGEILLPMAQTLIRCTSRNTQCEISLVDLKWKNMNFKILSFFLRHPVICLPVLFKTMHLVLSALIVSPFFVENKDKSCNILVRPSLLWEIKTKSSAHSRQLNFSSEPIIAGSFSSLLRMSGRSDMNILNNNGLRIHPCLYQRYPQAFLRF